MQINSYVSDRKKKRKKRRTYLFVFLGILIVYAVFFSVQWFIFHSPVLRVDNVVVQGNNSVASSDIIDLVEAGALQNHETFPAIFSFKNMLLWPDAVPQSELSLIPQLASVTIAKDYFSHTVTITVSERVPFGIWCFSPRPTDADLSSSSGGSSTSSVSLAPTTVTDGSDAPCYSFDNTGTIFEKSFDTQGNLIFVVYDTAQSPRGLNQKVLPDEFLPNLISIINVMHQSMLGVKGIDITDLSLEEVDVFTTNGPEIYFSLRFPANDDLPVIQKLMLEPTFDKIGYIDCRTENRIYYK